MGYPNENKSLLEQLSGWFRARKAGFEAIVRDQAVPGFHGREEFLEDLELERLRAERSGESMLLMVFSLDSGTEPPSTRARQHWALARAVSQESRKTDRKGWYGEPEALGVGLIPFRATARSVQVILNKIEARLRAEHDGLLDWSRVKCEVFTYPEAGAALPGLESTAASAQAKPANPPVNAADAPAPERNIFFAQPRPVPIRHLPRPLSGLHPLPLWKRALDVAGSLFLLILFSPVFLLIAWLVKLSSPGPVFYRQDRVGFSGNVFRCYKFRTMRTDYNIREHQRHMADLIERCAQSESSQDAPPMRKLDAHNPHITGIGRLLRPSHLDELPQLFNVLAGDMSLVGPRPCIPYEYERFQPWCRRRFELMPGITGLWQVKGKNNTTFHEMIRLDIEYARNRCLPLDLWILAMTIPTVIFDVMHDYLFRTKELDHAQ